MIVKKSLLLSLAMAFIIVFSSPAWTTVNAQKRKARIKTTKTNHNKGTINQSIQVSDNGQNYFRYGWQRMRRKYQRSGAA